MTMDEKEAQAFEDLAKLSIADDGCVEPDQGSQAEATNMDKENINVVFIGHVGMSFSAFPPPSSADGWM